MRVGLDELLRRHQVVVMLVMPKLGEMRADGLRVAPEVVDQRGIDEGDLAALDIVGEQPWRSIIGAKPRIRADDQHLGRPDDAGEARNRASRGRGSCPPRAARGPCGGDPAARGSWRRSLASRAASFPSATLEPDGRRRVKFPELAATASATEHASGGRRRAPRRVSLRQRRRRAPPPQRAERQQWRARRAVHRRAPEARALPRGASEKLAVRRRSATPARWRPR